MLTSSAELAAQGCSHARASANHLRALFSVRDERLLLAQIKPAVHLID